MFKSFSSWYTVGIFLFGALAFLGVWVYTISAWGQLWGFTLGWIFAILVAIIVGILWPILIVLLSLSILFLFVK